LAAVAQDHHRTGETSFTERQAAVLESALQLLVEGGDRALTTAAIARAANCSKESLYKWFGDRNDLLAAMVFHQASKVGLRTPGDVPPTAEAFRGLLERFATDLLTVLAGDVSIALNRLAIGQASRDGARLGELVRSRGRDTIRKRASGFLEAGRKAGYLEFADADDAYRTLYGLIVGDLHVRMLLGERPASGDRGFEMLAKEAVNKFFTLYGKALTSDAKIRTHT
jgi:AcrR family transcriptional regulator